MTIFLKALIEAKCLSRSFFFDSAKTVSSLQIDPDSKKMPQNYGLNIFVISVLLINLNTPLLNRHAKRHDENHDSAIC